MSSKEDYKNHLNTEMEKIKPSLKTYENLPNDKKLYKLVLTIGKYQDTLYNWYAPAPNYNPDENRMKYLLDIIDKEDLYDIKRAYKKI